MAYAMQCTLLVSYYRHGRRIQQSIPSRIEEDKPQSVVLGLFLSKSYLSVLHVRDACPGSYP